MSKTSSAFHHGQQNVMGIILLCKSINGFSWGPCVLVCCRTFFSLLVELGKEEFVAVGFDIIVHWLLACALVFCLINQLRADSSDGRI